MGTVRQRAVLACVCLLLLASCARDAAMERRFEESCRAGGHGETAAALAACVERRWARYRFVPRSGGR